MKRILSYVGFSSFLLFFSVMFIPFFYMSTGKEYDYNQQVSRGFISRSAVFFELDTGAPELEYFHYVELITGEKFEFYSDSLDYDFNELLTSGNINPPDSETAPESIINTRDTSGLTFIERLLTIGTGDYFAAVHNGEARYVYINGDPSLPPVVSGRFFEPSECLSSEKLAVIGSDYLEETYEVGDDLFIRYNEEEFRVIGVAGLSYPTTLDSILFFNLRSAQIDELIQLRFFVDGDATTTKKTFEAMNAYATDEIGVELSQMDMPTTLTDIVSGGVYLKNHLTVLTFAFIALTYISILTRILSAEDKKIGAMLLTGISVGRIGWYIYGRIFFFGIAGIITGAIASSVILSFRYFQLSVMLVLGELLIWSGVSFVLLLLCIVPIVFRVRTLHIEEVIRKA